MELVDVLRSARSVLTGVWVRVPPAASLPGLQLPPVWASRVYLSEYREFLGGPPSIRETLDLPPWRNLVGALALGASDFGRPGSSPGGGT
jgi:hypothetical protein